jgi:ABC-type uncharacterized transport system permease subunit
VTSILPLLLYLAAGAVLFRSVRAHAGDRPWLALTLAYAGIIVHGSILFRAIDAPSGIAFAITDSASLVGFVIAVTTGAVALQGGLAILPGLLWLLGGVLAVGTGVVSGFHETHGEEWQVTLHIAFAALAAGWLSISAVIVACLYYQNTRLRRRLPLGTLALLPPVETLEKTLFRALGAGYAVLTLVLVTGSFFVHDLIAQHLVHKVALAVLAWGIFGVLLIGRLRYGWRGRTALRFTTAGFIVLALAYFGSKFVLENLLGRHWG